MYAGAIVMLLLAQRPPVSDEAWGGGGALGEVALGFVVMTFPVVGFLVVRRQRDNRIGWLLLGIGLVWGLILLYSDGHLPSPRWRPVVWLSAVPNVLLTVAVDLLPGRLEESPLPTMENPIAWGAAEPVLNGVLTVFFPLFPLCIVACAVGLVRRFRRSRGVERLQLKWLATAGAVVAFVYLVAITASILDDLRLVAGPVADWFVLLSAISTMSFVLLPCAIDIAVLRYGLTAIDVVINRTLVYAALTASLAGVAGLFGPARRWIQLIVDRRFYRSRYNGAQTLDEFAVRLRHQVDLDAVGADLRGVVHATVQPAHVSLWTRP